MLHDKDIREPLFDYLEERYGKVRILEEKTMGKSRADVVMVLPKQLCGIEIKSDADTYVRLASQVKDYDKYYDCNIVVVGTKHAMNVHKHVPDYWGIITVEQVEGACDFYFLRQPQPNPKVTWDKKLGILWRPELAKLQEWHNMPKYKEKSKDYVKRKIVERIPEKIEEEVLRQQVSDLLFDRDYTNVEETLSEFRKGEIQKKLEKETDPNKQVELILQREKAKANLKGRTRKRRRRGIGGHR